MNICHYYHLNTFLSPQLLFQQLKEFKPRGLNQYLQAKLAELNLPRGAFSVSVRCVGLSVHSPPFVPTHAHTRPSVSSPALCNFIDECPHTHIPCTLHRMKRSPPRLLFISTSISLCRVTDSQAG